MKTLMKLALCFMLLVTASPAMAGFQLILPFTGATTSFGDVDFYTVSGDSQVTQNLGPDGLLTPGDTFLQNNVKLLFVSDTLNAVTENIFLGAQANKLYISANALTGFIDPTGLYYIYNPNQPASIFWDYFDAGNVFHSVKLADVIMTSGSGLLDDGVSGPLNQTPTGTIHLDGVLFNMLPGVFFSGATDLSTLQALNIQVDAALRGSNNVFTNTPIGNNQLLLGVHSNADLTITPTPEPATMALMGMGALGAAFMRRRNAAKA